MKTKHTAKKGMLAFVAVIITMSSCTVVHRPSQQASYGPQQMQGEVFNTNSTRGVSNDPRQHANNGPVQSGGTQHKVAKITGHEDLPQMDTRVRELVDANRRWKRDADGVLDFNVLKVVVSGGVIGWSGSDFGLEPHVGKPIGVTDRITTEDVVNACLKYKKLPNPSKPHWVSIRNRVQARLATWGVVFQQ